jgi:hypothetical protein
MHGHTGCAAEDMLQMLAVAPVATAAAAKEAASAGAQRVRLPVVLWVVAEGLC